MNEWKDKYEDMRGLMEVASRAAQENWDNLMKWHTDAKRLARALKQAKDALNGSGFVTPVIDQALAAHKFLVG